MRSTGTKSRVPGGSLGRSFSRSCGGNLAGGAVPLSCTNASCSHSSSSLGQQQEESRRSSLRVSFSSRFKSFALILYIFFAGIFE